MAALQLDEAIRALLREELRPLHEEIAALRAEVAKAERQTASELLSVKDAARVASVSVSTIRTWIRTGQLRRHGSGRLLRVGRVDVAAVLAAAPDATVEQASADDQAARILGRPCARSIR